MRPLLLAGALFLTAVPWLQAAPVKTKTTGKSSATKKYRKLADTIKLVLKKGVDRPLGDMSEDFGFELPDMPARAARYKSATSPDGREHAFYIVLDKDKSPSALVMTRTKTTETDGKKRVDSRAFRATLKGDFVSALEMIGPAGEAEVKKLDPNPDVKSDFDSEMKYYSETMAGREFDR
jgi:hypothetical protein